MSSVLASSPTFCDSHDVSGKLARDLSAKLRIEDQKNLSNGVDKEKEEEEEVEEFSFACSNPDGSLVSADELFHNGQIRPKFPLFDQRVLFAEEYDGASPLRPPLKKLFVEQRDISSSSDSESDEWDGAPEGSYCRWSGKKAMEASNETCKKSNSTGFSKLWRFRDLKLRSNSDGKDAFVFLNPAAGSSKKRSSSGAEAEKAAKVKEKASSEEGKNGVVREAKASKVKTASWAPEKHYVMNRAKRESDKRRSYLPYRVGFFTNMNGLSRNVHPF